MCSPSSTGLASLPFRTSCRLPHPPSCLALGGRLFLRRFFLYSFEIFITRQAALTKSISGAKLKYVHAHTSTYT